jgi:hypothetical protein
MSPQMTVNLDRPGGDLCNNFRCNQCGHVGCDKFSLYQEKEPVKPHKLQWFFAGCVERKDIDQWALFDIIEITCEKCGTETRLRKANKSYQ